MLVSISAPFSNKQNNNCVSTITAKDIKKFMFEKHLENKNKGVHWHYLSLAVVRDDKLKRVYQFNVSICWVKTCSLKTFLPWRLLVIVCLIKVSVQPKLDESSNVIVCVLLVPSSGLNPYFYQHHIDINQRFKVLFWENDITERNIVIV